VWDFVGGPLGPQEQLPLDGLIQTGIECASLRVNHTDITVNGETFPITITLKLKGPALSLLPEPPAWDLAFRGEWSSDPFRPQIADVATFAGDVATMQFGIPDTRWLTVTDLTATTPYNADEAIALLEQAGWIDADGDGVRELELGPSFGRLYGRSTNIGGWDGYVLGQPACGGNALEAATTDACALLNPLAAELEWIGPIVSEQDVRSFATTDALFANCAISTEGDPLLFLSVSRELMDLGQAQALVEGMADTACTTSGVTLPGIDLATLQGCTEPVPYTSLFRYGDGVALRTIVFGETSETATRVRELSERIWQDFDSDGDGERDWMDLDMDGDGKPDTSDLDTDGDGWGNYVDMYPRDPKRHLPGPVVLPSR
jgi:hypothetical protein